MSLVLHNAHLKVHLSFRCKAREQADCGTLAETSNYYPVLWDAGFYFIFNKALNTLHRLPQAPLVFLVSWISGNRWSQRSARSL